MRLEPKQLQQELKQGLAWPVYWIHGEESYRVREVCSLLQRTLVGDRGWCEDRLEGAQARASDVLASFQSIPLGGGMRVVWVRDAHLILQSKETEQLAELFGPRERLDELPAVCIFVARDLDGRRKFSKQLLDQAAVIACEAVPEENREGWVRYLLQSRGLPAEAFAPGSATMQLLLRHEPWSLDWVQNELTKWELSEAAQPGSGNEVLVGGGESGIGAGDAFISAFIEQRNLRASLEQVEVLSSRPELSLPLLGLLAWNVRMLGLLGSRSRAVRIAPMQEGRLRRALQIWSSEDIQRLQEALFELDFAVKQTPQEPLALWGVLVQQFCPSRS